MIFYEILILQDEKNLRENLWKPQIPKGKMVHEQLMYGVKKRYYLAPRKDDPSKDFVR